MANNIKVISAVYGTITSGVDVTQVCQNIANNGNSLLVSNGTMGIDPDPLVVKSFGIIYDLPNGTTVMRAAQEGQTINLGS